MSESSSLTADERLSRAYLLRHEALQLLHLAGGWQEIEGYPGRLRAFADDRLFVLHRTPFQPPPISDAAVAAGISAEAQRQAAREYGLDIWLDNRKVLCLIWNGGDPMAVVMMRAGAWEQLLLDESERAARRRARS